MCQRSHILSDIDVTDVYGFKAFSIHMFFTWMHTQGTLFISFWDHAAIENQPSYVTTT